MPSLSKALRFFLIALVCLPACAAGTANPGKTAPAASPASTVDLQAAPKSTQPAQDELNARPGINDHYFQPGGPDRYRVVLEAETREIVRRREDIVDAIGLRKGMAVADIGAGTGLLTREISAQVGARGRVYAVDIVPGFLDLIRSRVEDEGLRNVTVVRGEERATGLGPGSIDVAFMCDTYHHLEFPQTYMRSVFRSLRPGGTLVVVDMKREEGESSPGVLRHVRAGKAIVIGEVEQAGFVFTSETELLEQNYYLHFQRP